MKRKAEILSNDNKSYQKKLTNIHTKFSYTDLQQFDTSLVQSSKENESSIPDDELESIRFFDKIKMRTNSVSHSKVPKLNLNFNHTTKNEHSIKKQVNALKDGRNNIHKPQALGYSTIAEFKKKKILNLKKKY